MGKLQSQIFILVLYQFLYIPLAHTHSDGETIEDPSVQHFQVSGEHEDYTRDPIELAGLHEGDIILGPDYENVQRNAINVEDQKWPDGVIPYVISPVFYPYDVSLMNAAFMEYHTKTCIKFRPRTTEKDYIYITRGNGCSSHVGRTGGAQPVVFGNGCIHRGIMIHELMHATGFWHEQSRWDRDDHVEIRMTNVANGMDTNFNKYTWQYIQSLDAPYDTSSVMHYGPHAFAKDRRYPTIIPKVPNPKMGQREGFSEIDILKINRLYNCINGTSQPVTTTTVPPSLLSLLTTPPPTSTTTKATTTTMSSR